MDKFILDNLPISINMDLLFKRLNIEQEDDDAETIRKMVGEAVSLGKPKAIYGPAYIESRGDDYVVIEGEKFTSRVMAVNFEKAHKVFPFIATCGAELENWSRSINDMLEQYWADQIKELSLFSAIEGLNVHMRDNFLSGETSAMNPGSLEDWPIKEQAGIFRLLGDTKKSIGVELTDSYLMLPVKSVSGIVFPREGSFESCQLCPREKCPGRRAPYDRELYDRKYRR